jgi:hypothetical protein
MDFTRAADGLPEIAPDAEGNFLLGADDAELHGGQIKAEDRDGKSNISFWDNADDWVSWEVKFDKPGVFQVSASAATVNDRCEFVVEIAGQQLAGKPAQTADWDEFQEEHLGRMKIQQPGEQVLKVRAKGAQNWQPMNLRFVKLTKAE